VCANGFYATEIAGDEIDLYPLEEPNHKELWKKATEDPVAVAEEIWKLDGKHIDENGGDVTLKLDDIIVQCCSWHFGKKDKNPVSFVRFINREDLLHSGGVLNAFEVERRGIAGDIREGEQEHYIRVFCRDPDPAKLELLDHKVKQWMETIRCLDESTPSGGLEVLQEDEDSSVDNGFGRGAVQLTQESGDEGEPLSPMRSPRSRRDYQSPIPLPNFASFSSK
jgi:hypothetical protein